MSSIGRSSQQLYASLARGGKQKRRLYVTPPSWYRKHALMYGQYEIPSTAATAGKNRDGDASPSLRYTNEPPPQQARVVEKGLWSMIMQKWVRFKVSLAALREIERKGGLDEYLLLTSDRELGGPQSVGVVFKHGLKEVLRQRNLREQSTTQAATQSQASTPPPLLEKQHTSALQ